MPRVTATFCISLPPEMAKEIETACRSEHRTRSELVREALRAYLREAELRAFRPDLVRLAPELAALTRGRRSRRSRG